MSKQDNLQNTGSVQLSDIKLYELALQDKHHQENRRDTINSYYISLFSAIIALIPFIERITGRSADIATQSVYANKIPMLMLCIIGIVLSRTWVLSLRRILCHVITADKYLISIERKYHQSFIIYINEQLDEGNAPAKVTKNQVLLPYSFLMIFCLAIIYFITA